MLKGGAGRGCGLPSNWPQTLIRCGMLKNQAKRECWLRAARLACCLLPGWRVRFVLAWEMLLQFQISIETARARSCRLTTNSLKRKTWDEGRR